MEKRGYKCGDPYPCKVCFDLYQTLHIASSSGLWMMRGEVFNTQSSAYGHGYLMTLGEILLCLSRYLRGKPDHFIMNFKAQYMQPLVQRLYVTIDLVFNSIVKDMMLTELARSQLLGICANWIAIIQLTITAERQGSFLLNLSD
jgi:hypothetical protein